MKWIHVKAIFDSDNLFLAEELVSDIFFSLSLKGVVCQVPLPEPEEGFGSDAIPIPLENSISGYFPDTESSIDVIEKIKAKTYALSNMGINVKIKTKLVDQEDWAESWKDFFFVSRITDKIVIKPAWREFTPQKNDIIIELDPGMAFGTGTHPTTSMCILMIEKYLASGASFLDIGTGSGILMIAAAKLGAATITGMDNDEIAVQVSIENLEANSINSEIYNIYQNTLEQYQENHNDKVDLVVANIIAHVIFDIIPDIKKSLKRGGKAILSGIIIKEKDNILSQLTQYEFSILEVIIKGEWTAIAVQK